MKSLILHVISLARLAIIHTRGWAVDSPDDRVRLQAELDGAGNEVSLLKEEIRIKVLDHAVGSEGQEKRLGIPARLEARITDRQSRR